MEKKNDINKSKTHTWTEKGKHYTAKAVLCALTYLFDFNRPKKFTRINAKTLIYDENCAYTAAKSSAVVDLRCFLSNWIQFNWKKKQMDWTIRKMLLSAQNSGLLRIAYRLAS